jgi:sulfatase modifying factor 1
MTNSSDDSLQNSQIATGSVHSLPDMERILGGRYMMGSNNHYPEEAPAHRATVGEAFWSIATQ